MADEQPNPLDIFEALCDHFHENGLPELSNVMHNMGLAELAPHIREYCCAFGLKEELVDAFFDNEIYKETTAMIMHFLNDPQTWLFIRFLYDARMYGAMGE